MNQIKYADALPCDYPLTYQTPIHLVITNLNPSKPDISHYTISDVGFNGQTYPRLSIDTFQSTSEENRVSLINADHPSRTGPIKSGDTIKIKILPFNAGEGTSSFKSPFILQQYLLDKQLVFGINVPSLWPPPKQPLPTPPAPIDAVFYISSDHIDESKCIKLGSAFTLSLDSQGSKMIDTVSSLMVMHGSQGTNDYYLTNSNSGKSLLFAAYSVDATLIRISATGAYTSADTFKFQEPEMIMRKSTYDSSNSSTSKIRAWVIVVIVLSCLIGLALIIFGIYYFLKRKRNNERNKDSFNTVRFIN